MSRTIKEIAKLVGGEIVGDHELLIDGIAGIEDAKEGDITFLSNPKYLPFLDKTKASAVITGRDIGPCSKTLVKTENPSLAFTKTVSFLLPKTEDHFKGIHKSVCIGKKVKLGKSAAIGACTVIEDGVVIGDNCVIYPLCYVGKNTRIGKDALIYPNVTIRERITIGDRVIIHSGTVIGSDGFGYVAVDGVQHKIPQVGTVVVEDDVEIGANVTVDRARFDKTVIGKGTKIDNLVQIAHNVIIGRNCLIVAQVGISGSSEIGNNVILAGQSAVVGHIKIGDNSIVMGRAGVTKSLPEGSIVWGTPAKPADLARKISACIQNLPKMYDTLRELKNKIEEFEKGKWKSKGQ
jgi:UDP-3-O-[3-hydroxymyristoyl] glucosamine N-acyltransferase